MVLIIILLFLIIWVINNCNIIIKGSKLSKQYEMQIYAIEHQKTKEEPKVKQEVEQKVLSRIPKLTEERKK